MTATIYLVSYDVSKAKRSAIRHINMVLDELNAVQALESAFLVEVEGSSAELMRKLEGDFHEGVLMLVIELRGTNSDWHLNKVPAGWLRSRGLAPDNP